MNRILLTMTAFAALTAGAASAADMPVATKAAAIVRPSCAQFGGFYVGAQAGGTYHTAHRNDDDGFFVDNSGHTSVGTGWNVGGQAGYNFQRNCTLFGVEIDGSWAEASSRFIDDPFTSTTLRTIDSKLRWFGTARTRTGIVVDDVLLYLTGGFAYANVENTYTRIPVGGPNEIFALNNSRWGWTAGAGTEWKFAPNWSLKSEALYVQLKQQQDVFFSPRIGSNVQFTNNDSFFVARIGVNYLFNPSPLVARY